MDSAHVSFLLHWLMVEATVLCRDQWAQMYKVVDSYAYRLVLVSPWELCWLCPPAAYFPLCSFSVWCSCKGDIPRSSFPEENKQICFIVLRPGIRNFWISFLSQSLHQILQDNVRFRGLYREWRNSGSIIFLKNI